MLSFAGIAGEGLNTFYPSVCVHCHTRIDEQKMWLCGKCYDGLSVLPEQQCPKCGYPLQEGECSNCAENTWFFTQAKSVFMYEGAAKSLVHGLKYDGFTDIAQWFANQIYKTVFYEGVLQEMDYVAAIPLHKVKQRDRGFNQSELMARSLANRLGLTFTDKLLKRKHNTTSQTLLNSKERRKNLRNAFKTGKISPEGKNILLVDDVFTTGTTVNEASKILMAAGAKQVFVLTACHGT